MRHVGTSYITVMSELLLKVESMAKRVLAAGKRSDGFHENHGHYVDISPDYLTASRCGDTYDNGICFSKHPLKLGEVFQLRIKKVDIKWAGSLKLGITTCNPDGLTINIVRTATDLFTEDHQDFWILSGGQLHHGFNEKEYTLNLHNLKAGNRVGVQVTQDGNLVFFFNGKCMGIAASGIPTKQPIYCIFDIYGRTKVISKELFQARKLEELCKETLRKYVCENDLDKLCLPPCMFRDIKQKTNQLTLNKLNGVSKIDALQLTLECAQA